jgi:hypothetical protein
MPFKIFASESIKSAFGKGSKGKLIGLSIAWKE